MWYSLHVQFRYGESTFDEHVTEKGKDESDALGMVWARILIRMPGAIYLSHWAE